MNEALLKVEMGVPGENTYNGEIRADEFLKELKGKRGIRSFREMGDNDSTVGGALYAIQQTLRDVPFTVKPADESDAAKREAEFVEQVLGDMEHSVDDHISEALSFLQYGFSLFEVVYKRRQGTKTNNPKKHSLYNDNRVGVRKLATRAQWTINQFDVDKQTAELYGIYQSRGFSSNNYIPRSKLIHYRTTTVNNDPSGRSILRNAFVSYKYLSGFQSTEAIAIERELTGMPMARIPADYLAPDATADKKAVLADIQRILRDVKFNSQGCIIIPSDLQIDADGKKTNVPLVDIQLITANGSRNIEIDPVIKRYQHDIARSIMAEFIMLGSQTTGSYALSKSKTDLFLRSLEAYLNTVYDTLNQQLLVPLWKLNGLDFRLMPKIVPGDVAPHDLKELGSFLRNLNGADINLSNQLHIIDNLLTHAELPPIKKDSYVANNGNRQVVQPVEEINNV
jgi:phage gp29-like protein